MDNVLNMIFVKDKQKNVMQANRAFIHKFPKESRAGVIGANPVWLLSDEQRQQHESSDEKVMHQGYARSKESVGSYHNKTHMFDVYKICFTLTEGKPFIPTLMHDITEQESLDRASSELIAVAKMEDHGDYNVKHCQSDVMTLCNQLKTLWLHEVDA